MQNTTLALIIVSFASALFGVVFLYIFRHEKFFAFAKDIEKMEMKKEKKWLRRFAHMGKNLATVLIGLFAGPLITALTVRILRPSYINHYLMVVFVSVLSSTIWLLGARGILSPIL